MTTIKSTYEPDYTCEITDGRVPGETSIRLRNCGTMQAWFSRADLIEALDATANADVKHRADVYSQLTDAESKLERVRREIGRRENAVTSLPGYRVGSYEHGYVEAVQDAVRGFRAALADTPTPDPIDAEARALHDAHFPESFTWENASGLERDKWRAVARKAREFKTEKG